MAARMTLARPYAKAVFALASSCGLYAQWSSVLQFLKIVMADERVHHLLKDRTVPWEKKADFIISIGEGVLQDRGKNLVRLLAEKNRLLLVDEIFALYDKFRQVAEKTLAVDIKSAFKIQPAQEEKIIAMLTAYLDAGVNLSISFDRSLLAGIIVTIGDEVIDATVRGQLNNLFVYLKE